MERCSFCFPTHTHAHAHSCKHTSMHTHAHACTRTRTHARTHTHAHAHMHTRARTHSRRWKNYADVIWRSLEKTAVGSFNAEMSRQAVPGWVSALGQDPPGEPGASSPTTSQSEAGTQAAGDGALLCPMLTCFPAGSWTVGAPENIGASRTPRWGARGGGTRDQGVPGLSRCLQHTSGVLSFACDAPFHRENGRS